MVPMQRTILSRPHRSTAALRSLHPPEWNAGQLQERRGLFEVGYIASIGPDRLKAAAVTPL
jgi:hypothetical protein